MHGSWGRAGGTNRVDPFLVPYLFTLSRKLLQGIVGRILKMPPAATTPAFWSPGYSILVPWLLNLTLT